MKGRNLVNGSALRLVFPLQWRTYAAITHIRENENSWECGRQTNHISEVIEKDACREDAPLVTFRVISKSISKNLDSFIEKIEIPKKLYLSVYIKLNFFIIYILNFIFFTYLFYIYLLSIFILNFIYMCILILIHSYNNLNLFLPLSLSTFFKF